MWGHRLRYLYSYILLSYTDPNYFLRGAIREHSHIRSPRNVNGKAELLQCIANNDSVQHFYLILSAQLSSMTILNASIHYKHICIFKIDLH